MKKSKKILTFTAAAVAAASMTGCFPWDMNVCVYGPPPDTSRESLESTTDSGPDGSAITDGEDLPNDDFRESMEAVYGPPEDLRDYEPAENDDYDDVEADVYGPPEVQE